MSRIRVMPQCLFKMLIFLLETQDYEDLPRQEYRC